MMDISNKTILVTGAAGGIGSILCKLLAAQGANLILTDYQADALAQLKAELDSQHAAGHKMVAAELTTDQGRQEIVSACTDIDAVINLAGIMNFNLLENQPPQIIEKTLTINLLAPVLLCHALIPILKIRPEALILNVGSVFGSIGHPGFAAYCTSKAGLKCFSESLARELADTSIRVAHIAPRAAATKLNNDRVNQLNTAMGNKSDTPDHVAGEIVKLFKSNRRLRYLGWPEKLFVHINAIFPGVVHKALVKHLATIKHFANQ